MKLKDKNRVIGVGMCVLVFLLLTTLPCVTHAGIPQKMNYQGYLTDAQGAPVNGTVEMVFSIYDVPKEGKPLWSETQSVEVVAGVYNVVLGLKAPFAKFQKLTFDVPYYLGVKVGEDAEMTPRMALTSVPYAFWAQTAETVPVHNHDATYLNATGDSMSASTSGPVLSVTNTGTGDGVRGSASSYNGRGISGYTSGAYGRGVYGEAGANEEGLDHYGGYFSAKGSGGRGVYGDTDGIAGRGVEGSASGSDGKGVYGYAGNTGDVTNYGGVFVARGTKGQGVYGHANNAGDETNYGGYFKAEGDSGMGAYGEASGKHGYGVRGYASNSGDFTNYGGLFKAEGKYGRGVYGVAMGVEGRGVYGYAGGAEGRGVYGYATAEGPEVENYGGYFRALGKLGRGVYGKGERYGGYFEATYYGGYFEGIRTGVHGKGTYGVFGETSSGAGAAVKGSATHDLAVGVYAEATGGGEALYAKASGDSTYAARLRALAPSGVGLLAEGGEGGWAARFVGNVMIEKSYGVPVILLGDGLDYAEGFDVSEPKKIDPGSVLIIDPENPGKLALSTMPYDTRVAGIVAGSKGLGSGVRLGAGQFDHNVALAGRVYCNVDATGVGIKPGDLLTTSGTPGHAMKATEYERAKGAILGKAMESLEQGKRGQILVLVTLQ